MKAGAFVPAEVNAAFDLTCPELKSEFARYPIKYSKWYGADDSYGKQPMFVASENDMGMKLDYVFCKRGPKGKGYYHFLTKISYVNLLTRISANPPPGLGWWSGGNASKGTSLDAWDTTKRVIYGRTRLSRPEDSLFGEQGIDHITQNHINPRTASHASIELSSHRVLEVSGRGGSL